MHRGALRVLRVTIVVFWALLGVSSLLCPPYRGVNAGFSASVYQWLLFLVACVTLSQPAVWRRLTAMWRAPLTVWDVVLGLWSACLLAFFVGLAVVTEAEEYGLSTFDAALGNFMRGSSGLESLIDAAKARSNPPKRPWTLSRVTASKASLCHGMNDGTKALGRLTRQIRIMREVRHAVESGPGGAETVDEEAIRRHLRAYLAAHPAEGVGGGGDDARGGHERGGEGWGRPAHDPTAAAG